MRVTSTKTIAIRNVYDIPLDELELAIREYYGKPKDAEIEWNMSGGDVTGITITCMHTDTTEESI